MEEQQTPSGTSPIYQESQQKNAKWLWLLIALIVIGALVFAYVKGIGPLSQLKGGEEAEESASPLASVSSIVSEPSPEATREAKLDKSEAAIRVLNGSGIAGAASTFKDFLEGLGWQVVSIGNAERYDFEKTVLKFKSEFSKFEDVLVKDLSNDYAVEVSDEGLEATDSADIEIIVGSK